MSENDTELPPNPMATKKPQQKNIYNIGDKCYNLDQNIVKEYIVMPTPPHIKNPSWYDGYVWVASDLYFSKRDIGHTPEEVVGKELNRLIMNQRRCQNKIDVLITEQDEYQKDIDHLLKECPDARKRVKHKKSLREPKP